MNHFLLDTRSICTGSFVYLTGAVCGFDVSNTKVKPSAPGDGSNSGAGDEIYADNDCWYFCDHAIWVGFVFGCK